jgi:hypothetical protein
VNDATRLLGATLGVAVIGSVYASLYTHKLTSALPASLPSGLARNAHDSVGAALEIAHRTAATGRPVLGAQVHAAASGAFFDGFSAGCLVAAGVSAAGAIMATILLPARPLSSAEAEPADVPAARPSTV